MKKSARLVWCHTMPNDTKLPKDFAYDKKYEEYYNNLTGKGPKVIKDSPFLGRTNRDIFLYSMALGFASRQQNKIKLDPNKDKLESRRENIPSSALHQDGEWLVYAVAMAETNDIFILLRMKEVARIAEQYANVGFPILMDMIREQSLGGPIGKMESELRKLLESRKDILEGVKISGFESETEPEEKDLDDSMEIIERLENRLRQLVERRLSSITTNWMKERIPVSQTNNILERWEKNRTKNTRARKLFKHGTEDPLINYSELSDLYEIIKWSKNWEECFEEIFQDRKVFESDMEQILMIRPDKAHSRALNKVQKAKLKAISLHFLDLIDMAGKSV